MNTQLLIAGLLASLFLTSSTFADDPFAGDPFGGSGETKNKKPTESKTYELVDSMEIENDIRGRLNVAVSCNFSDLPLTDAVHELSRMTGIPILIDERALEEIGLSLDEPVNLSLNKVSTRSFLKLMLRDLDLTYVIADEVMKITTMEAADENLTTKVYSLPYHVAGHADDFKAAMQNSIVPDTWDILGGPSTATVVGSTLVISATEVVHEKVARLIVMVDEKIGKSTKE